MFYQLKEYFYFLFSSTNQHGVHSPFVYDLVTKCFYKKTDQRLFSKFKNYRQHLLNNKNIITVTDFGSGSKIFRNNDRQVSKIAKIAGISNKKAKLLIRLTTYFRFQNILELGTSLGLATSAIHFGNPESNIVTLEGCSATANIAKNSFDKFNFKNIAILKGDFTITLPKITAKNSFDLIYFDGNHQKKATLSYFESSLKTAHNDSVFIFDDIHWSKEMKEAWEIIKQHPKVKVTIDVFYWGIVFFREEQAKEHFIIRV